MGAKHIGRAGVLALVVGIVAAACSSGPSAEVEAFCGDYVEVRGLMSSGPDEADPMAWVESLSTGLEDLKTDAPGEISTSVDAMADALLEPIANVDEEAYVAVVTSPEFQEDADVVDGYIGEECGFTNIDVTAIDYAFDADLEGIEAGTTAFYFNNDGSEMHEMALIRVNDDTTETIEELLQMPEEEAMTKTTFVAAAFAAPEGTDSVYADLDAGRYAIICFIPTGSTSMEEAETADGPPHFTQGMVQEFTIEG